MASNRDPESEVKVLRERVAQLESAMSARTDPLLLSLLQNAASFLSVVNPEGRFLATGRESEAFGSVLGSSVFEFTPQGSHEVLRQALAQACETGRPLTYEAGGHGENGEPDHVYHVRAVPVVTEGVVQAIVLVPTDITERVRLERSLRESNDNLRMAVDASGMGFWRWDIPHDRLEWDPRLREIFGVEQTPTDYSDFRKLIHPEDLPALEGAVRHALEQGTYPTLEHRIYRGNDGAERWILAAAMVKRDEAGKPQLLLGGGLDITERKQLARQMALAERVQAVGQLAAGIAHNFNNLLAVIIPTLSMAIERPTPSDPTSLNMGLTAAQQARDLIKSMLALTAAPDVLGRGSADAGEVVKRTVAMARATFPREITFSCSVEPSAVQVGMPAGNLEQVILNLLTNARDAVEEQPGGAAEIQVAVRYPPAVPEVVRISISDSGAGMTDETRCRIFEPFFTTKTRDRGTGLGLATVAARVRNAGGTVACVSQHGRGTTFTVELPTRPTPGEGPALEPAAPPPRMSGRVLVVDDEDMVRGMLRRVFESRGLEVHEAASAAQARAVLERRTVDLVFLDHSMPAESGLAALPSLRALTSAPVILFTGHAPELPDDVATLLRKPANPDEILRTAYELLSRTGAREA
ncbi:MAG TPA: ATP-binding protein [Polyangia bacterium]